MPEIPTVSVNRLAELDGQGNAELIDVRTPIEFRGLRAVIARNVPLDSLDPHAVMAERNGAADQPLYLICGSGSRSAKACQKFIDAGYANVVSVDGGTTAWDEAGLPAIRGKKSVSLERQVRITAGSIVLISGVLALTATPPLAGIAAGVAAAVGAGLVFAGITDSCMMGMLLAKMPWNQVKDNDGCCPAK
jgi:rhodanese-related sulfurtransferase